MPYLLAALRLGAANAVIGAVVAEVSTGLRGGIGRILVQFAGQASNDPAKAWGPIFGAVALGWWPPDPWPCSASCSRNTDERRWEPHEFRTGEHRTRC